MIEDSLYLCMKGESKYQNSGLGSGKTGYCIKRERPCAFVHINFQNPRGESSKYDA